MLVQPVVDMIHTYLTQLVAPGDAVIDATAGNGHDTLFLADLVGNAGTVYAFDVQEIALTKTAQRLREAGLASRVATICDNHMRIPFYVKEPVKAAVFNLGYLPGGDHRITTQADDTVRAVAAALSLLAVDGAVLIALYGGHENGQAERAALQTYIRSLPVRDYRVAETSFPNCQKAPICIAIEKVR